MKRELVALLLFSFLCLVSFNVLWHFLTLPLVGLQCVIVLFPDHTHLLFDLYLITCHDFFMKKLCFTSCHGYASA